MTHILIPSFLVHGNVPDYVRSLDSNTQLSYLLILSFHYRYKVNGLRLSSVITHRFRTSNCNKEHIRKIWKIICDRSFNLPVRGYKIPETFSSPKLYSVNIAVMFRTGPNQDGVEISEEGANNLRILAAAISMNEHPTSIPSQCTRNKERSNEINIGLD